MDSVIAYAWRFLRPDGSPTSVVLTLHDPNDGKVVALVRAAAERHGVQLEPLQLDEVPAA